MNDVFVVTDPAWHQDHGTIHRGQLLSAAHPLTRSMPVRPWVAPDLIDPPGTGEVMVCVEAFIDVANDATVVPRGSLRRRSDPAVTEDPTRWRPLAELPTCLPLIEDR